MPREPAYVLGMSPPAIMTADELLRIPHKHEEVVTAEHALRNLPPA